MSVDNQNFLMLAKCVDDVVDAVRSVPDPSTELREMDYTLTDIKTELNKICLALECIVDALVSGKANVNVKVE